MLDEKELRAVYAETLIEMAEKDDRIVLVEADLMRATGTVPFMEVFPERTVDVGVAEANMIGVAAGMAAFGKIPFANTFTPFATRRCFDQIAISVAYTGLNVKIGGTDPGIAAELNGGTHMSLEDVGIMRNLPGMLIYEAVDAAQLKKALPQIAAYEGPAYLRLFRRKAEKIYDDDCNFTLGKANTLAEGRDVTIIASGIMVKNSLYAAEMLKKEGIHARVVNMHTLKPIDREAVLKAANETGAIVTAENHNILNGLGSAVAEVLVENACVPMKRIGIKDHFGEVGKMEFLAKKFGLLPEDIANAVREVMKRKKPGSCR